MLCGGLRNMNEFQITTLRESENRNTSLLSMRAYKTLFVNNLFSKIELVTNLALQNNNDLYIIKHSAPNQFFRL